MESRILDIIDVTDSTYVLQFERNSIEFDPGQHLHLGLPAMVDLREYSVYSGAGDDYFEVLVKEIDEGTVSRQLRLPRIGEPVQVHGPYGFFTLKSGSEHQRYIFIATGTGIAPFHSIVRSNPDLDYQLIHGIRNTEERYGHDSFAPERITTCVSGAETAEPADRKGRVTSYLQNSEIDPNVSYYLCGGCDMIYEVYDILKDAGVSTQNVFAEVYF